jgi:N6-adenosine-specific RNA methylase IME4
MIQPVKQSNKSPSFEDSADHYQLRLLTLEAELKELLYTRAISPKQFRSRQKQLEFLANKLADIRATWTTQSLINTHDPLFPMPMPGQCDPEELRICESHLAEKAGILKKVAQDTTSILNWVKITMSGRSFSLRTNFYLSGLRTKMAFVEGKLRDAEAARKSQNRFVEELEKEELPASSSRRPAIEVLKEVFERLGNRNRRILALRKELQQETERIGWMERWLNFQEMKMSSYLPTMTLPEQAKLRALSKAVLKDNADATNLFPGSRENDNNC